MSDKLTQAQQDVLRWFAAQCGVVNCGARRARSLPKLWELGLVVPVPGYGNVITPKGRARAEREGQYFPGVCA